jgi:AraC family transcriptional regulator, ethanolamine operon transcriptional activator
MNYENFVSDLPRDNRISFDSVEENQEFMASLGINQDMKQLGKGVFRADMSERNTKQVELFADRFSTAVSMYLEAPADTIGFVIPRTTSGTFNASGSKISNDHLVIVQGDYGTDIVAPDLMGSESFTMSKSRFNELAEVLCPSLKQQEKTCAIKGDTAQLHALRTCILELISQQAEPDDEQLSTLIWSMISWADKSISNTPDKRNLNTICEKARIARLAQEFIHASFHGEVRIEDICRASGVGVRTLQRSFREYFDLTLTEYLKTVRLNAAHRELSVIASPQITVTETALKNGFRHLGRFSTEFHKRFGSTPSEMIGIKNINNRLPGR